MRSVGQKSYKPENDTQPAAKRRKLAPPDGSQPSSQPAQPSFAEVLARLKEEAGEAKGVPKYFSSFLLNPIMSSHLDAEGGADLWARPELPPLDEERDAISMYNNPCACYQNSL